MHSYNGPLGPPFVLEDSTGNLYDTTLNDIYGRLTIRFDQSPSRPDHPIVSIRVLDPNSNSVNAPPSAVLQFGKAGALGTINFPPSQSTIPMDRFLVKSAPLGNGICTRRFFASDGIEYSWTLSSQHTNKLLWTCCTAANYFIASYEELDDLVQVRGRRGSPVNLGAFSMGDSFFHVLAEILASLTIVRHLHKYNMN